jgi:hypothetical protein
MNSMVIRCMIASLGRDAAFMQLKVLRVTAQTIKKGFDEEFDWMHWFYSTSCSMLKRLRTLDLELDPSRRPTTTETLLPWWFTQGYAAAATKKPDENAVVLYCHLLASIKKFLIDRWTTFSLRWTRSSEDTCLWTALRCSHVSSKNIQVSRRCRSARKWLSDDAQWVNFEFKTDWTVQSLFQRDDSWMSETDLHIFPLCFGFTQPCNHSHHRACACRREEDPVASRAFSCNSGTFVLSQTADVGDFIDDSIKIRFGTPLATIVPNTINDDDTTLRHPRVNWSRDADETIAGLVTRVIRGSGNARSFCDLTTSCANTIRPSVRMQTEWRDALGKIKKLHVTIRVSFSVDFIEEYGLRLARYGDVPRYLSMLSNSSVPVLSQALGCGSHLLQYTRLPLQHISCEHPTDAMAPLWLASLGTTKSVRSDHLEHLLKAILHRRAKNPLPCRCGLPFRHDESTDFVLSDSEDNTRKQGQKRPLSMISSDKLNDVNVCRVCEATPYECHHRKIR